MSNFWPDGLELNDTISPMKILELAQEDWDTNSGGVLTLVLQEAQSTTNLDMIIVHAKHMLSGRTTTLFTVAHRPNAPYPATIQPKDDDLPDFLKKSYYKPGLADLGGAVSVAFKGGTQGHNVTNEWVSDTPQEFRTNLTKIFNHGVIKADILSLISNTPVVESDEGKETTEKQTDED